MPLSGFAVCGLAVGGEPLDDPITRAQRVDRQSVHRGAKSSDAEVCCRAVADEQAWLTTFPRGGCPGSTCAEDDGWQTSMPKWASCSAWLGLPAGWCGDCRVVEPAAVMVVAVALLASGDWQV